MVRRFLFFALTALSVIAVTCSSSADIEPADSYESLSAALEAGGMKVSEQTENAFLFSDVFSVPGIRMTASGEEILAFEFPTVKEAAEQASLVSADGYGIGLKYVNWSDTPQFFKNGNMIVLYDGSQALVMSTLIAAMGERFAGGVPNDS